MKKKPKTCKCIKFMNEKLAPTGYELSVSINFSKGTVHAHVATNRIDGWMGKRKRWPPLVIPNFCPFCGRKYEIE